MNFIRKYKYYGLILSLGLVTKILYDHTKEKEKENIANVTVEDIEKDIQSFSENEKRLYNRSMIYLISRPFPGRGYFLWKRIYIIIKLSKYIINIENNILSK